jgi:hypothetical protein
MLITRLLTGFLCLPLLGLAQATPAKVALYVGAKLSGQTGQPFNTNSNTRFGPALTIGAQFSPRLALQVSGAYTWRQDSYHDSFTANGQLVVNDYDTRLRTFTVPLLLRLTLTKPASRWHLDALAGPTLLFHFTQQAYWQTAQGQTTRSGTDSGVDTQAELSLGSSVRYSLTPRLEVVADALASLYVSGLPASFGAPLSSQLSSHVLAGLQFRFGQ